MVKERYKGKFVYADGAIREMVLWEVPKDERHWPHGIKYRLHYEHTDGTVVRYDNERGKGDHRHIGSKEETYIFRDVETLVADFLKDIEYIRKRGESDG